MRVAIAVSVFIDHAIVIVVVVAVVAQGAGKRNLVNQILEEISQKVFDIRSQPASLDGIAVFES